MRCYSTLSAYVFHVFECPNYYSTDTSIYTIDLLNWFSVRRFLGTLYSNDTQHQWYYNYGTKECLSFTQTAVSTQLTVNWISVRRFLALSTQMTLYINDIMNKRVWNIYSDSSIHKIVRNVISMRHFT